MTGSISWLYYSDRLLEFPLGLFGIAISTVILPTLARHHVNREDNSSQSAVDFRNTMDWGVRMILLLGVPAAIGIAVLAQPMLLVLFMRGSFTLTDVHAASYSLWAFNAGLLSFMLIKILANGYYARQDTKTPVKIGIIAMVSNMGFNVLAIPFSYVGLAIASAMSATLNAYLLYRGLAKEDVYHFHVKCGLFSESFRRSLSRGRFGLGITAHRFEMGSHDIFNAYLLVGLVNWTGCGRLFRRIGALGCS